MRNRGLERGKIALADIGPAAAPRRRGRRNSELGGPEIVLDELAAAASASSRHRPAWKTAGAPRPRVEYTHAICHCERTAFASVPPLRDQWNAEAWADLEPSTWSWGQAGARL